MPDRCPPSGAAGLHGAGGCGQTAETAGQLQGVEFKHRTELSLNLHPNYSVRWAGREDGSNFVLRLNKPQPN